jgi:hypothetical protein
MIIVRQHLRDSRDMRNRQSSKKSMRQVADAIALGRSMLEIGR